MELISFGEDLLEWVKSDIEEKYQISYPIFTYNFKKFKTQNEIIQWVNTILHQDRIIKYKYVSDNFFSLKDFYPDPSKKTCDKLISQFLIYIKNKTKEKYGIDEIYFKIGKVIYNEKGIIKELTFGLKEGRSRIWEEINPVPDPNPNKNRIIYEVNFYEETEYAIEIDSGFLELENKY